MIRTLPGIELATSERNYVIDSWARSFEPWGRKDGCGWTDRAWGVVFRAGIRSTIESATVALLELEPGEISAYCVYEPGPAARGGADLWWLSTKSYARRQGLARRLLEHVKAELPGPLFAVIATPIGLRVLDRVRGEKHAA